jgi:hypothetical protein
VVGHNGAVDRGGATCSVDDFALASPELWETVGRERLEEAISRARERGAVQTLVVCGPQDQPKRAMLRSMGHEVASEWYTLPFPE